MPRFYTFPADICPDYPYLLVNFFNRKKLASLCFKHAILDSGVTRIFFNWRKKDYPKHILQQIRHVAERYSQIYTEKIWVTIPDYPDDYYPGYVENNVERTIENIVSFIDIDGVRWLPVIQSRYLDIFSFYESCEKVREIIGKNYPRVAIGTVCKTKNIKFIVNCCKIAREYFPNSHIHAFGLTLSALPKVVNYINSWDSLAWTFPRKHGMPSCKNMEERRKYFMEYIERIKSIVGGECY